MKLSKDGKGLKTSSKHEDGCGCKEQSGGKKEKGGMRLRASSCLVGTSRETPGNGGDHSDQSLALSLTVKVTKL